MGQQHLSADTSAVALDYDDFFHRITGYLSSTLPAGLQHFNTRHNPGNNWVVLRYSEFKYSQYEIHLAKSSSHHKAYFGEGKVDLVAFYYGGLVLVSTDGWLG